MDYQGKKCLIAYFSHAGMNYVSGKIVDLPVGNTERAAQMLRLFTGGDLFHIRTASVYPNDYQEVVKIARKEKATMPGRPWKRISPASTTTTSSFWATPTGAAPCPWPCGRSGKP